MQYRKPAQRDLRRGRRLNAHQRAAFADGGGEFGPCSTQAVVLYARAMSSPRMDTATTISRLGVMLAILADARAIAATLHGTRAEFGVQALVEYLEIERERLRDGGQKKSPAG